jgi:hypothetical protein
MMHAVIRLTHGEKVEPEPKSAHPKELVITDMRRVGEKTDVKSVKEKNNRSRDHKYTKDRDKMPVPCQHTQEGNRDNRRRSITDSLKDRKSQKSLRNGRAGSSMHETSREV